MVSAKVGFYCASAAAAGVALAMVVLKLLSLLGVQP
jgi:hypothetical protein